MKRITIPTIIAGLVLLMACANPEIPSTDPFPSQSQHEQVVKALEGQIINEAIIVQAYIDRGFHRPDRVSTSSDSSSGTTAYITTLEWDLDGVRAVSIAYIYSDKPFDTSSPATGLPGYARHI